MGPVRRHAPLRVARLDLFRDELQTARVQAGNAELQASFHFIELPLLEIATGNVRLKLRLKRRPYPATIDQSRIEILVINVFLALYPLVSSVPILVTDHRVERGQIPLLRLQRIGV